MAKPGPKPTPTEVLKLRGSWRANHRGSEPQPTIGVPHRPDWLDAEAVTEWNRIVPELERLKLLTVVDLAELAAYCQTWSDYILAVKAVREHGETFTSDSGMLKKSPWVGVRAEAAKQLHRLADAFGFSPAARSRVTAASQPEEKGGTDRSRFFGVG